MYISNISQIKYKILSISFLVQSVLFTHDSKIDLE